MTHSVLYIVYTWQVLYPPQWISGILNKWMNEWVIVMKFILLSAPVGCVDFYLALT